MKKKVLSTVFALTMAASLMACGGSSASTPATTDTQAKAETETPVEEVSEAETQAETPAETEAVAETEAEEKAFLYNWDGSGEEGSDLYFNVNINGVSYQFTVESYLCGSDTEVYQAVKALKVGDVIDMEGFLYSYEGINPHITAVMPANSSDPAEAVGEADVEKSEGVMTFDDYFAAELDTEVTVECYVQAHQSWWDNKITVYAQDAQGGYFLYNMACSEEDAAKLVPGTKIKVTGYKSEWAGEVEIVDATFEIEEGSYIAAAADVTDALGTEDQTAYENMFVSFKGAVVEAISAN